MIDAERKVWWCRSPAAPPVEAALVWWSRVNASQVRRSSCIVCE